MNPNNLDENTISEFGAIRLTDKRVVLDAGDSGTSSYVTITLDAVASCGLFTSHQPWMIVAAILGVVAAVATFFMDAPLAVCGGLVVAGIVLFAWYMASRTKTLSISSMGGLAIVIEVTDVKSAHGFLDEVDDAKLQMLHDLRQAHRRHPSTANSSAP